MSQSSSGSSYRHIGMTSACHTMPSTKNGASSTRGTSIGDDFYIWKPRFDVHWTEDRAFPSHVAVGVLLGRPVDLRLRRQLHKDKTSRKADVGSCSKICFARCALNS